MNSQADSDDFLKSTTAEEYQTLIESFVQAFWETNADGRVGTDSPSWRAYTGQSVEEWLSHGWLAAVHPEDQAEATRQWQEAIDQQKSHQLEFRIRTADGRWQWTHVRATPIRHSDGSVRKWLAVTLEVTETSSTNDTEPKTESNQELAENQALLQATLDSSLEMIQVFKAVRNEQGEIVDFVWTLNNQAAEQQYGDVIGKSLLSNNPGVKEEGIFDTFKLVCDTGIPDQSERHYTHEQFDGWFYQSTVKLGDGVASTTTNITARKQAEEELKITKEHLHTILDSSLYTIQVFHASRDSSGKIVDFVWVMNNEKAIEQNGEVIGESLLKLNPGVVETGLFDTFVQVVETGISVDLEQQYSYEQFDGWFRIMVVKVDDGFVMNTDNITEKKKTQLEVISLKEEVARKATDRYLTLFNSIDEAVVWCEMVTDDAGNPVDYRLLEINPSYEIMTGLSVSSSRGKTARQIIPYVEQSWIDIYATVAFQRQAIRFENKSEILNRWFNVYASPVGPEADGQFVVVYSDVTEQKKSQEKLRKLEERTRLALEAAELATWEWDIERDLVYWNEQHFILLGLPARPEPQTSEVFLKHIHPEDAEHIRAQLTETIQKRTPYDEQFRVIQEGGQVRWMSGYGKVTAERDGKPIQLSGVMFDITARKEAEELLKQASRRKDEFLAMLAHELRNPMTTIRNGIQILSLTELDDPGAQITLSLMDKQTDHLVRMVDDLLDVSRISQGKIDLRKESVNLVDLITQAIDSVQYLFEQKQQHLQVHLSTQHIHMQGDPTRLVQVVMNLLSNASRYTKDQGTITLRLDHRDTEALIQVQDDGIGLAEDQVKSIFELFVQIDNSLARSQGGLGIGLTLVKQIVELHGGRIEAQSEGIDQGSTFTVHLPTPRDYASDSTSPKPVSKKATLPRILLIDDNDDVTLTLRMFLEYNGYDIQTRNSGKEGIEAAERLKPDVILLDIGMPDMDGYETCSHIRQQAWGKEIYMIAVSGYGQKEDQQRALQAGFDHHLTKPVNLEALMELLNEL